MRTLHLALRVGDVDRSLAFYRGLGYEIVGTVPESPEGHLTMLKLPGDDFVTIELVSGDVPAAADIETGPIRFVIQVESMQATVAGLADAGIAADEPASPNGTDEFLVSYVADPDGNRIELVQWPPDHTDGMTSADWM